MKINKMLVLGAIGLCAVTAQAGWTIVGNPTVETGAGATGTYVFHVTGNASLNPGNYTLGPVTATPLTIPSLTGVSGSLSASTVTLINVPYSYYIPPSGPTINGYVYGVAVTPFTVTVDWTVPLGLAPGSYDIAVNLGFTPLGPGGQTPRGTDSVGNVIVLVPAPEPAQTLAGAMLVGCGGIIFAGRRLFKKQSA